MSHPRLTAGVIQMFDSASIRAHVSAGYAKGGRKIRRKRKFNLTGVVAIQA